jgi:hypothetical protein
MILATNDKEEFNELNRYNLLDLLDNTIFDLKPRKYLSLRIYQCDTIEEYEEIERYLLANTGMETVVNPSQAQINKFLKRYQTKD